MSFQNNHYLSLTLKMSWGKDKGHVIDKSCCDKNCNDRRGSYLVMKARGLTYSTGLTL